MSDNSILPKAQSQLVDQAGRPTRAFYNFFNTLVSQFQTQINTIRDVVTRLAAVIAALGGDAGNLPDIPGMIAGKADKAETLRGTQSVRGGGDLSSPRLFALDGDMDNPPALSFYGVLTDGLGRGWQLMSGNFIALDNGDGTYALDLADLADSGTGVLLATTFDAKGRKTGSRAATITGTAGRVTVTNGNASAGLPTIDLATVADAGGGALLRFVRDAWGRLSGTSAATTSDLAEGANLYFTVARVLATVLTSLSTATNAVITAADSVLGALGKLQAQITGNFATPPPSLRNLLINATGAINQRGYVSGTATTAANQYTVDRWKVQVSGQNLSWTISAGIATFTAPAGGVAQVVEAANVLGGTYTLSFTGTATATVNGTVVANGATIALTGNANATVVFSGGTFSLPQLEKSPSATSFDFRPVGVELSLCLRYFEKSYELSVVPGSAGAAQNFVFNYVTNPAYDKRCFTYSVKKRAAPSITFYSDNSGATGKAYNLITGVDIACLAINASTSCFGSAVTGQSSGNEIHFHYTSDAEL